ncbi:MAG: hypothetical protein ACE5F7_02045 [Nitrospiria bacterium]
MTQKNISRHKGLFVLIAVLIIPLFAAISTATAGGANKVIRQVTLTSVTDPIPGHGAHQLALLLPPDPGKIFTGTLTFTASKPVEVVVFHEYQLNKEPGTAYGSVLVGDIGGKKYAISVMQFSSDVKATNSSTVNFTGSGVALHTLNGDKFTASATINAVQEKIQP